VRVFVAAGMFGNPTEKMKREAIAAGTILGRNGYTLLQGGSNAGMMGLTLTEFLKYSSDVEAIVPEIYKSDVAGLTFKKVHLAKDLSERLHLITQQSDKIIVLPGGQGTLLELLYANESKRAMEHNCEIFVVNADGIYRGLQQQISDMRRYGLTDTSKTMISFVGTVSECFREQVKEY